MSTDRRIQIPPHELRWRFSRASGPGGQNVNTRDTRAEVRWSLRETAVLSAAERDRVRRRLASRLHGADLVITASRYRSQERNRADAHARLEGLVSDALAVTKPRRRTAPSRASRVRVGEAKRRRSATKSLRRAPDRE